MQLSSASHGGLLDSDCRLAAMARSLIRVARSTMHEMKFGLIGFAIGTMAITGATLASAPKQPVANHVAVHTICRMARSWGIGSDRSFGCGHCGVRYAVRAVTPGNNDSESVYCEVCLREMSRLNSAALAGSSEA